MDIFPLKGLSFNIIDNLFSMNVEMSFWERIRPPEDISTNGHLIDWLFNYITIMDTFFFGLVCLGLFGFSYLYSKKRHPKPLYTHGDKKKHLMITGFIATLVFVAVDMNITRISNNDLIGVFWNYPDKDEDVIRIEVMAQQWMWNFRYAGEDQVFNTEDDYISNHQLVIPVGKKVELRITSKDVIHSLYVPNVRLKVDAIPGRITRMWFDTNKVGEYEIACAEMCGTHHYLMKGGMSVLSQKDYKEWLNQSRKIATYANDTDNLDNYWGWKWETK